MIIESNIDKVPKELLETTYFILNFEVCCCPYCGERGDVWFRTEEKSGKIFLHVINVMQFLILPKKH